jgi:4-amino-4-deoxy-L-arabinose transferase-like glycosyltransferase
LWSAAGRLGGRQSAFFAAALFALLGPVLHLGAFATTDSMSLALVALAAWFVVRAGDRGTAARWMVAAGVMLALANATAYSSVLFDLFVAALAGLTAAQVTSWRTAARRIAALLTVTAGLLAAGAWLGGASYRTGFARTTLAQVPDSAPPLTVLSHSWYWAGLVVILAVSAVVISAVSRQGWTRTALLAILASAAVAGPLEQARMHTESSLNKHVGLGAWFAAMAAGYAVDRFIAAAPAGRARAITLTACVAALAFPVALGAGQSLAIATSWANARSFIAVLRPYAEHGSGRLLVEDPSIAEYYLPAGNQWQRWSSTRSIVLPSGASVGGPPASASVAAAGTASDYARFIAAGYFSVVALNFADTTALDHQLAADLQRNPYYQIVQVVPYGIEIPPVGQGTYVIWQLEPTPRHGPA